MVGIALNVPGVLRLLVIVAGFAGWTATAFCADDPAVTDGLKASPKVRLSPESEAKLVEFSTKLREAKRRAWMVRMKKEIEQLVKATELGPEGIKALEQAAEAAAEFSAEKWGKKVEEIYRRQYGRTSDQLLRMLTQVLPQVENLAQQEAGFGIGPGDLAPFEQAGWKEAVQRTLNPEQAASWAKIQDERKRAIEKDVADTLKRAVRETGEQQRMLLLAKSADIKLTLNLTSLRAEQLDAAAKQTAEQNADAWKLRAEKVLLETSEQQRKQFQQRRQFYLPSDEKETAAQQARWEETLSTLLSPEELQQLQVAKEEHRARRVRILGQMMIALLDEKVAFTSSQRQALQVVAEKLISANDLFLPNSPDDVDGFNPETFFSAASNAEYNDVKGILDAVQWRHWKETCTARQDDAAPLEQRREKSGSETAKKQVPAAEPEEVENRISDFLFEKSTNEHKRTMLAMLIKAEDAARVTQLSGDSAARLRTAALGAAEQSLNVWKVSAEQAVRDQVRDATVQNLQQRLRSIQEYVFRRDLSETSEKGTVLEKTTEAELSEPKMKAWQKELDERSTYRQGAIASTIMAAFDRKHLLTAAQWRKLEPVVASVLKEYATPISRMFSSYNETPWFLQSYSMFIPIAAVPEKELKEILCKEQWDRWTGSNECTNCTSYWSNIQASQRRVKAVKP